MSASRPSNFQAMSDAWNDPEAFAREVAAYYEQLAAERQPALIDITEPRRGGDH